MLPIQKFYNQQLFTGYFIIQIIKITSNNKSAILITFKNRLFQLINSPDSKSCSDIEKGSSQVDLFKFLERLTYRMYQRTSKAMRKMFTQFINSRSAQINSITQQKDKQIQFSQLQRILQEKVSNHKDEKLNELLSTVQEEDNLQDYEPETDSYELPPTFFMKKKQKAKYFNAKNQTFQNKLGKTKQRISKNKHKVQFKEQFLYKPFNENEKVNIVQKSKQFSSKYDNKIHFS